MVPFLVFVFCLFACKLQRISAESVFVNFDRLAPVTGLQKVLECCLQVQHEFDQCDEQYFLNKHDAALFVDMMVGKLFHLQFCAKKLSVDQEFAHNEDVVFVLKIIKKIKDAFQRVRTYSLPEQASHIELLLGIVEAELLAFQ